MTSFPLQIIKFHFFNVSLQQFSNVLSVCFTKPELLGLTCTEANFIEKSGFQHAAAKYRMIVINADTSPRNVDIPGDSDCWDFGKGFLMNFLSFFLFKTHWIVLAIKIYSVFQQTAVKGEWFCFGKFSKKRKTTNLVFYSLQEFCNFVSGFKTAF